MDSFLEGPAFAPNGNLYVVDIAYGRVFSISPEGAWTLVVCYDGWPTGLKLKSPNEAVIADNRLGIVGLKLDTGEMTVLANSYDGRPFNGCNDLCFASNGDLYFTDQGTSDMRNPFGRIFRLRIDGRLELVADGFPSPNGLVLTRKEDAIYVAVTQANAIWRVKLRPDGSANRIGSFIQLSGSNGGGPDGLAMDEEDNLFVAHAYLGSVWGFSRIGEPIMRIRSSAGIAPTNLAFGPPLHRSLYITEAETGTVLRVGLTTPGRRLVMPAS